MEEKTKEQRCYICGEARMAAGHVEKGKIVYTCPRHSGECMGAHLQTSSQVPTHPGTSHTQHNQLPTHNQGNLNGLTGQTRLMDMTAQQLVDLIEKIVRQK